MEKMNFEVVDEGVLVDTLSDFLPNAVRTMTDDELDLIYGGAVGCNCKFHCCQHCIHVECLKLCKAKMFGDNTVTESDTLGTILVR